MIAFEGHQQRAKEQCLRARVFQCPVEIDIVHLNIDGCFFFFSTIDDGNENDIHDSLSRIETERERMDSNETVARHVRSWSKKLASCMDIHRQRFSQSNQRLRHQRTAKAPLQVDGGSPHEHWPEPPIPTRRDPCRATSPWNSKESKQTRPRAVKRADADVRTETSTSIKTSAGLRTQSHLQGTATRWWKQTRPSESNAVCPIHVKSTRLTSSIAVRSEFDRGKRSGKAPSLLVESQSLPKVFHGRLLPSLFVSETEIPLHHHTRQEALIMQALNMRLRSTGRCFDSSYNTMAFNQHQRLIGYL